MQPRAYIARVSGARGPRCAPQSAPVGVLVEINLHVQRNRCALSYISKRAARTRAFALSLLVYATLCVSLSLPAIFLSLPALCVILCVSLCVSLCTSLSASLSTSNSFALLLALTAASASFLSSPQPQPVFGLGFIGAVDRSRQRLQRLRLQASVIGRHKLRYRRAAQLGSSATRATLQFVSKSVGLQVRTYYNRPWFLDTKPVIIESLRPLESNSLLILICKVCFVYTLHCIRAN